MCEETFLCKHRWHLLISANEKKLQAENCIEDAFALNITKSVKKKVTIKPPIPKTSWSNSLYMEFHSWINEVFNEYEALDLKSDDNTQGSVINSTQTINKLTHVIRDVNVLDYSGNKRFRLSTLLSIITRAFGFNGFSIEINQIAYNNDTLRFETIVDIIITSDGSVIQGVSKRQRNLKVSITHAIKHALTHEVERIFFNYK